MSWTQSGQIGPYDCSNSHMIVFIVKWLLKRSHACHGCQMIVRKKLCTAKPKMIRYTAGCSTISCWYLRELAGCTYQCGGNCYMGSGHMPEEPCQVSPKSHYGVLASHSDPSPLDKCRLLQGSLLFSKFEFSIKPDLRVLNFYRTRVRSLAMLVTHWLTP